MAYNISLQHLLGSPMQKDWGLICSGSALLNLAECTSPRRSIHDSWRVEILFCDSTERTDLRSKLDALLLVRFLRSICMVDLALGSSSRRPMVPL